MKVQFQFSCLRPEEAQPLTDLVSNGEVNAANQAAFEAAVKAFSVRGNRAGFTVVAWLVQMGNNNVVTFSKKVA